MHGKVALPAWPAFWSLWPWPRPCPPWYLRPEKLFPFPAALFTRSEQRGLPVGGERPSRSQHWASPPGLHLRFGEILLEDIFWNPKRKYGFENHCSHALYFFFFLMRGNQKNEVLILITRIVNKFETGLQSPTQNPLYHMLLKFRINALIGHLIRVHIFYIMHHSQKELEAATHSQMHWYLWSET